METIRSHSSEPPSALVWYQDVQFWMVPVAVVVVVVEADIWTVGGSGRGVVLLPVKMQ